MSKIQETKRSNGRVVNSVNIPVNIMEDTEWKKGDNVILSTDTEDNKKIVKIKKED